MGNEHIKRLLVLVWVLPTSIIVSSSVHSTDSSNLLWRIERQKIMINTHPPRKSKKYSLDLSLSVVISWVIEPMRLSTHNNVPCYE
jgi:hypothetical protein